VVRSLVSRNLQSLLHANSRWPWALLEAAYNGSKDERSIESIVMALAGEELITVKSSDVDADEYCADHLLRWLIDAD
jgi:hypothetical protein